MKTLLRGGYTIASLLMLSLCAPSSTFSQCVLINEVLVNGPGNCDGSCTPNTEEWVELYNTCGAPIDISCWGITDGDWAITIPSGTVISANGFFTLGGASAEVSAPDLDWGNCGGCASSYGGSPLGVFTNGGEQVAVFDASGNWQDGIFWSGGQALPAPTNTSPAIGGCPGQTMSLPASSDPLWENIGSAGGDGCTKARTLDGGPVWEQRCLGAISYRTSNGGTFPVELEGFSASVSGQVVEIQWNTLSELNNDEFIIQRSAAESLSFIDIGSVKGLGNTTQETGYAFTDLHPLAGKAYYRLKQIDFDGKVTLSDQVTIEMEEAQLFSAYIAPNPASGNFNVFYHSDSKVRFRLMDLSGKMILSTSFAGTETQNQIQIDASKFPQGLYLYEFVSQNGRESGKLLIN